jgi:hypothetical protein
MREAERAYLYSGNWHLSLSDPQFRDLMLPGIVLRQSLDIGRENIVFG